MCELIHAVLTTVPGTVRAPDGLAVSVVIMGPRADAVWGHESTRM